MKMPDHDAALQGSSKRNTLNQLLVLLCLTGFAITEPVLTILGANPEIFFFHDVESRTLITVYALIVAFFPALLLWIMTVAVAWIHSGLGRALHCIFVGMLGGLWLIQLLKWRLGIDIPEVLTILALLGAAVFVFAYVKWPVVKSWLNVAAIAPFVVVGVFLLSSESGSLMRTVESGTPFVRSDANLPPVLFILLDEFPTMGLLDETQQIDKVRFPNLAELADNSTWYRHYTVLYDNTVHSVPSILTGNEPQPLSPSFANFPGNLFSLLAPTHHLTVFETLTGLCGLPQCSQSAPDAVIERPAPQMRKLFEKTARLWLRQVSPTDTGESSLDDFQETISITGDRSREPKGTPDVAVSASAQNEGFVLKRNETLEKFEKLPLFERMEFFMDTFVPDKAALYFIHLQLPHVPWRYYGNGKPYLTSTWTLDAAHLNQQSEWFNRLKEYRFLMQAQYVDQLLGEVFSRLKSEGMWDDLLVIVTADHGRSFKPGQESRKLDATSIDGVAYVPLFVKRPHQESGRIDDSNLMTYDLVPTIADVLGVDIPWSTSGLPAGHEKIAERGDVKEAFFRRNDNAKTAAGRFGIKQTFSDRENFPQYTSRWIGTLPGSGDPLLPLNISLELDNYLGRSPDEFDLVPGGHATISELSSLQHLPVKKWPPGLVIGHLNFESRGEKVLVAINGNFVTGSPLIEFDDVRNSFIAMLPQGVLVRGRENDIGVYLVNDNGLSKLELSD